MSKILLLINCIMQVVFEERKDKYMRIHYYKFPEGTNKDIMREYGLNDDEDTLGGIPVSEVKKLIKKYGGGGYTMHCERDGTLFETTPITLKGNNSKFKYNRHL